MVRRGSGSQYVKWRRRCWGLALLLVTASLAPMIYCVGWAPTPADMEAVSVGYCVGAHPLQFPTTIFVSGVLMAVAAVVLRQQELDAERAEEDLQRRVERAASRQSVRTPAMDRASMRGTAKEVPTEIEVDDEIEFGVDDDGDEGEAEDSNSVMAFLQEQQQENPLRSDSSAEKHERRLKSRNQAQAGIYVPPGMEDAPVLYLDGGAEAVSVADASRRIDNPELAYVDAEAALRHAFDIVMNQATAVVVRVMPGIYQTAIEIPDRVTVINHRMPAQATVDERLAWLRQQSEADHIDRVTFLAPESSKFGVRMMPGSKQGLFGCYVVGRPGIAQTGLEARDNVALAVVHCAFESFSRGGAQVIDCGEELPGRRAQFVGCLWRQNAAAERGGGLRVDGGAVRIEASIFDSNRAPRGGAIAVKNTEKPLLVERSLLQRNRALAEKQPAAVEDITLKNWRTISGVGGALLVCDGLVKLKDTIIDGNDAVVGGGAIAALAARVVVASTGEDRGVCRENRADAGGGVLAVGWSGEPSLIRVKGAQICANLAKTTGGAAAALGNAVLHLQEAVLEANRAAGQKFGMGGGVCVWRGGGVQVHDGKIARNRANCGGGGVAVFNGFLKLSDGASINRNEALGGPGGGVMAVTVADADLDRIMGQPGFSLPFKIKIDEARISANSSADAGGGLAAGSLSGEATFPMALMVRRVSWINENTSSSDRRHCQNVWVQWAEKVEANDDSRGTVKLALKACT